jgi:hypothetical protein
MGLWKKDIAKDESGEMSSLLASMIGAVMIIVVGIIFLPLVQDQVDALTNNVTGSLTGVAASLAEQIPLFYVLGLVFAAIGWVVAAIKGL